MSQIGLLFNASYGQAIALGKHIQYLNNLFFSWKSGIAKKRMDILIVVALVNR